MTCIMGKICRVLYTELFYMPSSLLVFAVLLHLHSFFTLVYLIFVAAYVLDSIHSAHSTQI